MSTERSFHLILVTTATCAMMALLLFFKQESPPPNHHMIAQTNVNNYYGPHERPPNNSQLIRIQILVSDDPDPQGVQITSVTFNGQSIPLKPRDIYGFRAQASFQLLPGKYNLQWKVNRSRLIWPRTNRHEEEVNLSPRDLWIQIEIKGDSAAIS